MDRSQFYSIDGDPELVGIMEQRRGWKLFWVYHFTGYENLIAMISYFITLLLFQL